MDVTQIYTSIFIVLYFLPAVQLRKNNILPRLLREYEPTVRPGGDNGGPVVIEIRLDAKLPLIINENEQTLELQATVQQKWTDERLIFSSKRFAYNRSMLPHFLEISPIQPQYRIWLPDTYIENDVNVKRHDFQMANHLIRIYPDGSLTYIVRLTITSRCPMNFAHYPLDSIKCRMQFQSYSMGTDDLQYAWHPLNPIRFPVVDLYAIPNFWITSLHTTDCTKAGYRSCRRLEVTFRRSSRSVVIKTFVLPLILVIAGNIICIWQEATKAAHWILGVLPLLLQIAVFSVVMLQDRPLSLSLTADEIWHWTCTFFLILQLAVFVALTALQAQLRRKYHGSNYRKKKKERIKYSLMTKLRTTERKDADGRRRTVAMLVPPTKRTRRRASSDDVSVDELSQSKEEDDWRYPVLNGILWIAKFLLPTTFGVFNLVFWYYYLFALWQGFFPSPTIFDNS